MIKLTTNSLGIINTSLSKGVYYVFLPDKVSTKYTPGGDERKCREWKNLPNGTFSINKDEKQELALNLNITCSPCGAPRM